MVFGTCIFHWTSPMLYCGLVIYHIYFWTYSTMWLYALFIHTAVMDMGIGFSLELLRIVLWTSMSKYLCVHFSFLLGRYVGVMLWSHVANLWFFSVHHHVCFFVFCFIFYKMAERIFTSSFFTTLPALVIWNSNFSVFKQTPFDFNLLYFPNSGASFYKLITQTFCFGEVFIQICSNF